MNGAWKATKGVGERTSDTESSSERVAAELDTVPADVAALYRWLDVQEMPYREFAAAADRPPERAKARSASLQEEEADVPARVDATRNAGARGHEAEPAAEGDGEAAQTPSMLPERVSPGRPARLQWHILDRREDQRHDRQSGRQDARWRPRSNGTVQAPDSDAGAEIEARQREMRQAVDAYAQATPYAQHPATAGGETGPANGRIGENLPVTTSSASITEDRGGEGCTESSASMPAWIGRYAPPLSDVQRKDLLGETLKRTRERIAGRWFGLRGLLKARAPEAAHAEAEQEALPPIVVLYSSAGGTGKTSLAATLTRALAAQGERVLLMSLSRTEILPYYFGAGESRPEERRVFTPPPGVADAPVHLLMYPDVATGEQAFEERLRKDCKGFSRVVVDASGMSPEVVGQIADLGGCVLVPLLPDIGSLLTLGGVRRRIAAGRQRTDREAVWYVLTRFDASQPLHLDVREVLELELADRLMPIAVRDSTTVAEALAQGMTVLDYAPGEGVSQDMQQLAAWVRTLEEPAREGLSQLRWSERL